MPGLLDWQRKGWAFFFFDIEHLLFEDRAWWRPGNRTALRNKTARKMCHGSGALDQKLKTAVPPPQPPQSFNPTLDWEAWGPAGPPHRRFQPAKVREVSVPCTAMCQWVHAMFKYYHVNLEVAPKRAALAGAEGVPGWVAPSGGLPAVPSQGPPLRYFCSLLLLLCPTR